MTFRVRFHQPGKGRPLLPLDGPRWSTLETAFGTATDLPASLRELAAAARLPESARDELLRSLWESLCHQGLPDEAAYAVVPHLVDIVAKRPPTEGAALLHLVGSIVANRERGADVPADLAAAYADSVGTVGPLILLRISTAPSGNPELIADLAAVTGHPRLGRILSRWPDGEVGCRCGACGEDVYLGTGPSGLDASPLVWMECPTPVSVEEGTDIFQALAEASESEAGTLLGGLAGDWGAAVAASAGILQCSCGSALPIPEGVDAVYS